MSMSLLSARYGKHDAPNQIAVNQIIHTLLYHRSARNVSQRPDTDCAESERLSGHDRVLRGQRGVHQRDDERFKVGDTLQSAATRRTDPFEARQVGRPAEERWRLRDEALPCGWTARNTLITPHFTAAMPDKSERSLNLILDNLRRFRGGQPMRKQITPDDLYTH